jgi:thiol-disulfide isomerase/thioredoxin
MNIWKLLAACLFGLAAAAHGQGTAEAPSAAPLFAAALHDFEDKPAALESLRGRPLIVNFWARWCGPCRQEIPELVRLHDKEAKRGLTVVGIALDDNLESTRDFAQAYDMRYKSFLAKSKGIELMQSLGNAKAVLPFTLVIGRDGKVLASKLGPVKQADLDAYVKLLLGKS